MNANIMIMSSGQIVGKDKRDGTKELFVLAQGNKSFNSLAKGVTYEFKVPNWAKFRLNGISGSVVGECYFDLAVCAFDRGRVKQIDVVMGYLPRCDFVHEVGKNNSKATVICSGQVEGNKLVAQRYRNRHMSKELPGAANLVFTLPEAANYDFYFDRATIVYKEDGSVSFVSYGSKWRGRMHSMLTEANHGGKGVRMLCNAYNVEVTGNRTVALNKLFNAHLSPLDTSEAETMEFPVVAMGDVTKEYFDAATLSIYVLWERSVPKLVTITNVERKKVVPQGVADNIIVYADEC